MFQPLVNGNDLTPEQREARRQEGLKMCTLLGLDPATVKADSFELMAAAHDTVRVRWTGMGKADRAALLELFPDAVIV